MQTFSIRFAYSGIKCLFTAASRLPQLCIYITLWFIATCTKCMYSLKFVHLVGPLPLGIQYQCAWLISIPDILQLAVKQWDVPLRI